MSNCRKCQKGFSDEFSFCPICGESIRKYKDRNQTTLIGHQQESVLAQQSPSLPFMQNRTKLDVFFDLVERLKALSRRDKEQLTLSQTNKLFYFSIVMVLMTSFVAVAVIFLASSAIIKSGAAVALWGFYRTLYSWLFRR